MIAYQGLEGVIPILSEAFQEEKAIAKDLHFSSVLLYLRSNDPIEIINPTDFIEKKSLSWRRDLQERYDLITCQSIYVPFNNLKINVPSTFLSNDDTLSIFNWLKSVEPNLLNLRDGNKLRERAAYHVMYSNMREAKKRKRLQCNLFPRRK